MEELTPIQRYWLRELLRCGKDCLEADKLDESFVSSVVYIQAECSKEFKGISEQFPYSIHIREIIKRIYD